MTVKTDTLDELAHDSLALRNLLGQVRQVEARRPPDQDRIDALTGDRSGPAAYDLTAIWRASLADPDCRHISQHRGATSPQSRRYMSPRRFVNGWPHLIEALVEPGDGRILVDRRAAFDYCQRAGVRIILASSEEAERRCMAAAREDPIGTAVRAARGGGFAMMFARHEAEHLGMTDGEFAAAVLARARAEAASLDDYAAERLVSEVRQALGGAPALRFAHLDDGGAADDGTGAG